MHALYRKPFALPSLALALLFSACDGKAPQQQPTAAVPDIYLEALQEAEALKHSIDERNREQQRIDQLLGRNQVPAR